MDHTTARRVLEWTADGLVGLLTFLVAGDPWGPGRRRAGYHEYVEGLRSVDGVMRRVAPPMFLGAIGTNLGAAALSAGRNRSTAALRAVGAGLVFAAVRVTLTVNDPVNVRMRTWDLDAAPGEWREQRAEWERGHRRRGALLVGASLLAGAARWRSARTREMA